LLKHGYSKFKVEILEYCDLDVLIKREQYFIDLLNPEYNILKVAGSLFGYKHSPETLKKMKEIILNRSDEEKADISAKLREAALGRTYKHTEETKIKIRNAILGRKHSEESKEKMRIIQSNRIKHSIPGVKVEVKDIKTGQTVIYDSLRIAGKELNSSHAALSYNLKKGKELFRGRYRITIIKE
jgi:group I intron endonuclease